MRLQILVPSARDVRLDLAASLRTSRTVRDLVVGSDLTLEDRGGHPLKGVEGTWELYAVVER